MIKASRHTLASKVGRRIFTLFILAAFLPVVLISIISYDYIRDQISVGVRQQIRTETRNLGLNAFDRLLTLEGAMEVTATDALHGEMAISGTRKEWLNSMFEGMTLYEEGAQAVTLVGDPVARPAMTPEQAAHIDAGGSVITVGTGTHGPYLVMTRTLASGESGSSGLLVTRPRAGYLWNFAVYRPALACAVVHQSSQLACSSSISEGELDRLMAISGKAGELHAWQYNNTNYAVNSWSLFLAGRFEGENVDILLAEPVENAFLAYNSFKAIFPRALIVTILIVAVLSISYIRKHLEPLEKLAFGMQRIRDGNFKETVDIRSGDEFQTLAESFNQMSERIDDQIATLELMSSIDRLILSAVDVDHVVRTLMNYLHNFAATDHIAILTLTGEDRKLGRLYFNTDPAFREIDSHEIHIPDPERVELALPGTSFRVDDLCNRSYLQRLRGLGDRHFIVLPLRTQEQPIGMICMGNAGTLQIGDRKLGTLHEIANRISVALLNKESEEKLFYQAHFDVLTNLPNRYLLRDRLEQALGRAERTNSGMALLFVDLDRFKSINDSLGHTAGDEMLGLVAERMAASIRDYDTLARFGGDEFVVIAEEPSPHDIAERASILARRILESLNEPFTLRGRQLYAAASIGVAVFPHDARSADDLLKFADSAMYQAKSTGRNTFCFYESGMNADLLEHMDLGAALRHALERDELMLVYQPKISCRTRRPIGAEALVRWNHPTRGEISPADFIPIAEETGLIRDIGEWVLRRAASQARAWTHLGIEGFHIAVNLSAAQFKQVEFCARLESILAETGVAPANLELEITESVTMEDFERSSGILKKLHALGVSISIDDFGTGYSSFSYLQQFNVHRLKVDQSFIAAIPDNPNSVSIVKAIIALAHTLGLDVTAEGIETQPQYDCAMESGFDELQGYFLCGPLAPEEFERYCAAA